jgi:hypothetical protein
MLYDCLGDAGDFLHAAGERERALKCRCLSRNAGYLTGLDVEPDALLIKSEG